MTAITVNFNPIIKLTDDQFYQLCQANPNVKFERNVLGEIIIMPPTGGTTGNRNFKLAQQLANWTDTDGTGIGFDSSTCFQLPNGSNRSPDAAWIPLEKWNTLTPEQQEKFPPLCPDFVVELRSASDALKPRQEKMQEYMENGTRLGWLINGQNRQVEIYRQGREKEVLDNPAILSGEDILPGFRLNLLIVY
ncbi:Uma2 family endonuclease [Oscillatoria sp. HE19RPO]|uniref:Uma2 family endonuclease n=1 Tax=Oscillatoria sp. HE19RPO TaxID=2954806 RepID=UPI0020C2D3E0|nr:Uma2 family endonuclease [Oscillatoria sp. HE19RPO]